MINLFILVKHSQLWQLTNQNETGKGYRKRVNQTNNQTMPHFAEAIKPKLTGRSPDFLIRLLPSHFR